MKTIIIDGVEYNLTPKVVFHEGDWIVWQNKCYKVNYNGCGYELIDQNGLSTSLEYGTVDKSAHFWSIHQDAKDGDVLYNAEHNYILIYKHQIGINDFVSYCRLGLNTYTFYSCEEFEWDDLIWNPATKEQLDTLMKAMTDAGYTFDFESKELKKIEPTECKEKKYSKCYVYNLPHNDEMCKQCEFNPKNKKPVEWSEEDEMITLSIEQVMNCASLLNIVPEKIDKIRAWLKSLKDKYTWKPSDEQMQLLKEACDQHWEPDGLDPLYTLYQDLKNLKG